MTILNVKLQKALYINSIRSFQCNLKNLKIQITSSKKITNSKFKSQH